MYWRPRDVNIMDTETHLFHNCQSAIIYNQPLARPDCVCLRLLHLYVYLNPAQLSLFPDSI